MDSRSKFFSFEAYQNRLKYMYPF